MPYTKALKIGKALKSAARLPAGATPRKLGFKADRWKKRGAFTPNPDEQPIVILKVQVLGCQELLAGDSNGFSDPFVTLTLLNTRFTTPVIKKTLNPVWSPKDATFQFPIYLSLADRIGALELIVWDKDALKKEYLGEVALQVEDWFGSYGTGHTLLDGTPWAFDDPNNEPVTFPIVSTRESVPATGTIQLKIGFVPPESATPTPDAFETIYKHLVKRSRPSIVSAPPTEGIGTIRSHHHGLSASMATPSAAAAQAPHQSGHFFEDDGGLSSSSSSDEEEDSDEEIDDLELDHTAPSSTVATTPASTASIPKPVSHSMSIDTNPPPPPSLPVSPVPPMTAPQLSVSPASPTTPTQSASKPGFWKFGRRKSTTPRSGSTSQPTSASNSPLIAASALPASTLDSTGPSIPAGTGTGVGLGLGLTGLGALADDGEKGKGKEEKKRRFSKKSWNTSGSSTKESSTTSRSLVTPSSPLTASPTSSPKLAPVDTTPGTPSTIEEEEEGEHKEKEKSKKKKKSREKNKGEYRLGSGKDIVGIVMLEIRGASDLPKLANMTRTGWDMDPFVVISFGKKVFRTRVIRHSLNPIWDEKLLFHVRRYETSFKVNLAVLDWDKLSANDNIGDVNFDVKELIESAPQPDPETGLYKFDEDGGAGQLEGDMKDYTLQLVTEKGISSKHTPTISFRAKYQPYAALRQRFWRQYIAQYDSDDVGQISHLELTSMLDSLGSTLTPETINSFWTKFGKKMEEDTLTVDQVVTCLEEELTRPDSEKRRVHKREGGRGEEGDEEDSSVSATPILGVSDREGKELQLDGLDFTGPNVAGVTAVLGDDSYRTEPSQIPLDRVVIKNRGVGAVDNSGDDAEDEGEESSGFTSAGEDLGGKVAGKPVRSPTESTVTAVASTPVSGSTSPLDTPSLDSGASTPGGNGNSSGGGRMIRFTAGIRKRTTKDTMGGERKEQSKKTKKSKTKGEGIGAEPSSGSGSGVENGAGSEDGSVERVINVKNCPLCHRPRMGEKAEVDIITHLAVCASKDWNKVDRIVVGNFVTASQAQRKWYTKVLTKISSGDYKLGANSANIIVQNRMTGQLEEEKMQVYVRLGIRLLYKGAKGRMESAKARGLLKSLSIKQGIKYDAPESARDIPGFIEFHQLNTDEILDPLDSFKNFNEFFYRKLKASARPVEQPENPYRLVSAADCRFMAFESVSEATRIWIKGREFSVSRLLGDTYKDDVDKYTGGALAIFRLAPQDYHRFHSPVDGRIGKMTYIAGEYYTVNPQAIRTALDVYGENARKIVPIDSPQFGRVMAVCVGAMMVGTIQTTVEEGQFVKRGEEFGYFAFGGSTIVMLFEKGVIEWDEDLQLNGKASLETLVRVGMGIGNGHNPNN